MSSLLYIQASPRKKRSHSSKLGEFFVDEYQKTNPNDTVEIINLFDIDLPEFDEQTLDVRYALLHGQKVDESVTSTWENAEKIIEQFVQADKYVLSSPMWNFGVPYRLKWYFDTIIQPGYTFKIDPEKGYIGAVNDKPILVIHASGGDYSQPDSAAYNMERPYIELALGFIGFTDIKTITVAPTIAAGPEKANEITRQAMEQAEELAKSF